jgi:hypothetical protein
VIKDGIEKVLCFITKQLFGFAPNNRPVAFIFNIDIIEMNTNFVRGATPYAHD